MFFYFSTWFTSKETFSQVSKSPFKKKTMSFECNNLIFTFFMQSSHMIWILYLVKGAINWLSSKLVAFFKKWFQLRRKIGIFTLKNTQKTIVNLIFWFFFFFFTIHFYIAPSGDRFWRPSFIKSLEWRNNCIVTAYSQLLHKFRKY